MGILETATIIINRAEEHHGHEEGLSFTEEFTELVSSPAHWLFELMFSVLFDLIIISLIYGVIIKKFLIPRLRKSIHAEIDREHGIEHTDEWK